MTSALFGTTGQSVPGDAFDLVMETLQAATAHAIFSTRSDGTIVMWNEGATRLFGFTAEEAVGKRDADMLFAPGDPQVHRVRATALHDGQWEGIIACLHKDGKRFEVRTTVTPRQDGKDASGFVFIAQDVRSQHHDASHERKFRGLLESASDPMVIVDSAGCITLVNVQTEKLFGYARDELCGKPVEMLVPERFHAIHQQQRSNFVMKPKARPTSHGMELFGRRKDGVEFPVEISLSPMETEEGLFVAAAIRDMTERTHFEHALQEKNRELESAILAKDRFLAGMSHELRTPLNAIIGFTGTLLMKLAGPLTDDQEQQLQTVQSNGRHLLSLINDILDLARIESGKVDLHLEPIVVQQEIDNVATSLRAMAKEKRLQLDVSVPDSPVMVLIDRRALRQILINLTNNAIKYTEAGWVRMEVVRRSVDGRPVVDVDIVDTGIGIKLEDQSKLFQAFEQLDQSSTRRFEGAGLGLHLSKKLAALLGASLLVRSESGKGSTFTLRLQEIS